MMVRARNKSEVFSFILIEWFSGCVGCKSSAWYLQYTRSETNLKL